jgi:adenylosuccinate lyase
MHLSSIPLVSLNPLDGRYRGITAPLVEYLSEAALNRARTTVETEWMILLANGIDGKTPVLEGLNPLTDDEIEYLRSIPKDFDEDSIAQLARFEAVTHHDVKAVEYYIDSQLDKAPETVGNSTQLPHLKQLVHFACTSEDINNLAYAISIKSAVNTVWLPALKTILGYLEEKTEAYADTPMLALTHGQPATPTTLGKEFGVFLYRLTRQFEHVKSQEYLGKFNGATGTFGAHTAADPSIDWMQLSKTLVTQRLGLDYNPLTTQIESHDWQAELYSTVAHVNSILHNLAVDMWMYISRGIFIQEPVKGATGSSTMPHKVNPINFENAEANFELSNALLNSLSATLVESRWQRDLTDSTTQRNIGIAFGYSLVGLKNLATGLGQVHPDLDRIEHTLDENWEVLGEPIQTVMRAAGLRGIPNMDNPYERVKDLMRGEVISKDDVEQFLSTLGLPEDLLANLRNLTPRTYVGLASELARVAVKQFHAQAE